MVCDDRGAVHLARPGLNDSLRWIAEHTNPGGYAGDLAGAVRGADVFIGLSAPGILSGGDVAAMAGNAIVFALANPDPEVDPEAAMEHAAVVATGRSDYPNQINNVLAFPGVFRGLLDAQSWHVSDEMLIAAAQALADVVSPDEIGRTTSSRRCSTRTWPRRSPWRCGTPPPSSLTDDRSMDEMASEALACRCSWPPRCSATPTSAAPSFSSSSTRPSRARSAWC